VLLFSFHHSANAYLQVDMYGSLLDNVGARLCSECSVPALHVHHMYLCLWDAQTCVNRRVLAVCVLCRTTAIELDAAPHYSVPPDYQLPTPCRNGKVLCLGVARDPSRHLKL
jgi:hypothetical protein